MSRDALEHRRPYLIALIAAILLATPVAAQPGEKIVPLEGTQAFRQILSFAGLQPLKGFAALHEADPQQTVLIIFGSTVGPLRELRSVQGALPQTLKAFIDSGGAVLIASEQSDIGSLHELGITIYGEPVVDPTDHYLDYEQCPLVKGAKGLTHPVFEDITRGVATNRPSHLAAGHFPVLGSFSDDASSDFHGVLRKRVVEGGLVFAAGTLHAPREGGRVLVLAGYGQFINGTMLPFDNDNFRFAWNCVRWLRETEGGRQRTHALFIDDGKIVDTFDGPLAITIPRVSLAAVVNRMLDQLQKEDFFRQLLWRWVPRDWILRGVIILVTVALLFFGRRWLVRGRARLETEAPLVDLTVEGMLAQLPPLSRRHRAMMSSGNFYDAARALARHLFEMHLGREALVAEQPPTPRIDAGRAIRRRLQADLQWLWELAYGAAPSSVSSARLAKVVRACHGVDAAILDGKLQFVAAPVAT